MSLYADDMILYVENPKGSTQKLLEMINDSKVTGYKISIQKSVEFLCINNEVSERESKKKSPVQNCIKNKQTNKRKPRDKPDQAGERLIL